jgi:argininosuccinate lyase
LLEPQSKWQKTRKRCDVRHLCCSFDSDSNQKELSALSLEELKSIHLKFEADVKNVFRFEHCVDLRDSTGGTSRRSVLAQAEKLKQIK